MATTPRLIFRSVRAARPLAVAGTLALGLALVVTALAPAACTYSPEIESGKLSCSLKGECPRGFTCAGAGPNVGRCVSGTGLIGGGGGGSGPLPDGGGLPDVGMGMPGVDAKVDLHFDAPAVEIGTGSGGNPGTGGSPGTGGAPSSTAASYLGTWVMGSDAYVYTDCGSGSTSNDTLAGETLSIYTSNLGPTILGASWSLWAACTYELYLDGLGLHLNDPNWSCGSTAADPAVYWFANTFDITTSNGITATHTADYSIAEVFADGTNVYCYQLVSASMTKR